MPSQPPWCRNLCSVGETEGSAVMHICPPAGGKLKGGTWLFSWKATEMKKREKECEVERMRLSPMHADDRAMLDHRV